MIGTLLYTRVPGHLWKSHKVVAERKRYLITDTHIKITKEPQNGYFRAISCFTQFYTESQMHELIAKEKLLEDLVGALKNLEYQTLVVLQKFVLNLKN